MQDDLPKSPPIDAGSTPPVEPSPNSPPSPIDPLIDAPLDRSSAELDAETPASPAWADDLRKLYDAVVEEPLPDSLIDLLSKLDSED